MRATAFVLRDALAAEHPALITAEYRIARRPPGRALVDYNQNAWRRTLASVHSPRPAAAASLSTPVTRDELAGGATTQDFRIDNVPARIVAQGDLWAPIIHAAERFELRPPGPAPRTA